MSNYSSIKQYPEEYKEKRYDVEDLVSQTRVVHLPPMIKKIEECNFCFSKEVCSLAALSLEADIHRKAPAGHFDEFQIVEQKATPQIKAYFKRFVECINLEQTAESDRHSLSSTNVEK